MDITSILQGIKGKVLDAAHFDLLKHAYELQEQNINQLKSNNEAIKESNLLIQEKNKHISGEMVALESRIQELEEALAKAQVPETALNEPSSVALAVLGKFKERDVTDMYQHQIAHLLPHTNIEVESALDELSELELISFGSVSYENGVNYYLTGKGKKFLLAQF